MAVLFKKSYVSALSDNVKKRNKYAWEKGAWTGKPPIGYKKALLDNGKHTFIINDSKTYYIKAIFNLYAHSGYSLKKLERDLHRMILYSQPKSLKKYNII